MTESKRRYKARGLCIDCGEKAKEGRVRCAKCLDRVNSACRARYNRLKKKGLCTVCGKEAFYGHIMCPDCIYKDTLKHIRQSRTVNEDARERRRTRARERKEERRMLGICQICNKPATHGDYCLDHMLWRKRKKKEAYERKKIQADKVSIREYRKSNNLCYYCGEPLPENNIHGRACNKCAERFSSYFKADTPANKAHKNYWRALNSLAFVKKRCKIAEDIRSAAERL